MRNPLGVVLAYSKFLLQGKAVPAEQRTKFLETIQRSAAFMLNLVNDMLDISEIEAGKLNLSPEPVDLVELCRHVVELNGVLAEGKRMRLTLAVDPDIPPVSVDRNKIEQVLNNLVTNAVKYGWPDSVVDVSLQRADGFLELAVTDRGQGIPPQEIDKLFKPFQKTSVKSTGGEKSTGLGLAIVKRIVEGHGGSITVESEPGRGSTFTVRLPAVPASSLAARPAS
jgi:signal transduction histidine kinase